MTRQPISETTPKAKSAAVLEPATVSTTPISGSRANIAAETISPTPAHLASTTTIGETIGQTSALLSTIRTLGELLDDLEQTRIANGNRIAAMERDHGEALPHLDVVQKQIRAAEHLAELELARAWRRHPLAPWAKASSGVGEKSIARLVAVIGDPAERPNVAKLWAYCGHGDAGRRPARGMTQAELFKLGNPKAKKQTWLIAAALLKAGVRTDDDGVKYAISPFGQMYIDRRQATADRVHAAPCVRCGPSGHPAAVGSPWSAAHQHADALRFLGKQFLKELWIAGRHFPSESHSPDAARHTSDETHTYDAGCE